MKGFFAVVLSVSFVFLAIFGVNCVYGYLFPMKYQDEISVASQKYDVEEAIIYSVINIETHFRKDAVSSKGAVGLMQVMPATAEELAQGNAQFDLKVPADNINLGTCYLSKLISRFEDLETALCAYNAGPTNVKNWLADERYSDDGKTLKKIPFTETRDYVQKFWRNYKYYMKNYKFKSKN